MCLGTVPSNPFRRFFQSLTHFPTCMYWSIFYWILTWNPLKISGVLYVTFSSPIVCLMNSKCVGLCLSFLGPLWRITKIWKFTITDFYSLEISSGGQKSKIRVSVPSRASKGQYIPCLSRSFCSLPGNLLNSLPWRYVTPTLPHLYIIFSPVSLCVLSLMRPVRSHLNP